jgi:hypothetical protein
VESRVFSKGNVPVIYSNQRQKPYNSVKTKWKIVKTILAYIYIQDENKMEESENKS